MKLLLVLGNQLFSPEALKAKLEHPEDVVVFMREDQELCQHFRYHQQKLVFFLAAMREYADELRRAGFQVHYEQLDITAKGPPQKFEEAFENFVRKSRPASVAWYEIEDKFFEVRMQELVGRLKLELQVLPTPMFLTSRERFKAYLSQTKKPFMKTFYEAQRKRLKILVDEDLRPLGGQWSFDEDNRKSLPKGHRPPEMPSFTPNSIHLDVIALVKKNFPNHPGNAETFWLPTDRAGARRWLIDFLEKRFHEFGPYEDAFSKEFPFIYHSVLTPFLNVGLLTPREVVAKALQIAQRDGIPMNSCEGFVRQVIGWREFIRGIYQNFSEHQETKNFWNHQYKFTHHWYEGTTGIEPLDDVIKKTLRYGYAHHIERLMIVGNLQVLLEVHPHEAHRWFMEMFIDSSDWVMGPNVYGMALFSDGGIFATKPYICGSNYYKKMGKYAAAPWQDEVDGLYWRFIDRHSDFFTSNPRLSMMVKTLQKMPAERKQRLFNAAAAAQQRLVE